MDATLRRCRVSVFDDLTVALHGKISTCTDSYLYLRIVNRARCQHSQINEVLDARQLIVDDNKLVSQYPVVEVVLESYRGGHSWE